jgi:hypothetical protein
MKIHRFNDLRSNGDQPSTAIDLGNARSPQRVTSQSVSQSNHTGPLLGFRVEHRFTDAPRPSSMPAKASSCVGEQSRPACRVVRLSRERNLPTLADGFVDHDKAAVITPLQLFVRVEQFYPVHSAVRR